jgi:FAD/FMN-containing dehydrogenase
VHPVWADARTVFSLGVDWRNDATATERKRLKERLVNASLELERVVGPGGGTYVNEANPYEPNWQSAFWGLNYERLLQIKKRVDPKNLMVCNRCVGTDIVYEP